MLKGLLLLAFALTACGSATSDSSTNPPPAPPRQVGPSDLRAPADFAPIADIKQRSSAIFLEASRVLTHPRCINCHPSGDIPHHGMSLALHDPPVVRGPDDHGVVGMECTGCHQDKNQELTRVPGAPKWALAPIEMAWVGKSPRAICEQLKDPKRNGGKTLAEIVHHNAHDELVAWGWRPGADREKAPGTQEQFGALFAAWLETGAECPPETAKP
ncbi:MAG TPA: Isoquinoline 1-oxidoreductase subunit [Polyangiaceae bacterium]|jgi:hypothetical protein|nr:Isoquinoline 1-oxidoreductase subunit [Polyangiaceae bacterium]